MKTTTTKQPINQFRSSAFLKAKFMLSNATFKTMGTALNFARLFIANERNSKEEREELRYYLLTRNIELLP